MVKTWKSSGKGKIAAVHGRKHTKEFKKEMVKFTIFPKLGLKNGWYSGTNRNIIESALRIKINILSY